MIQGRFDAIGCWLKSASLWVPKVDSDIEGASLGSPGMIYFPILNEELLLFRFRFGNAMCSSPKLQGAIVAVVSFGLS